MKIFTYLEGGGLKFFPRFLGGYQIVYLKFHLSSTPSSKYFVTGPLFSCRKTL